MIEEITGTLKNLISTEYDNGEFSNVSYKIENKKQTKVSHFYAPIPEYFIGKEVKLREEKRKTNFGLTTIIEQSLMILDESKNPDNTRPTAIWAKTKNPDEKFPKYSRNMVFGNKK